MDAMVEVFVLEADADVETERCRGGHGSKRCAGKATRGRKLNMYETMRRDEHIS